MTTIDEQSPKAVGYSKFIPPAPTPFSSPVGSIVDDDSMNLDPEKAMGTVSDRAPSRKRSTVSFSKVEIIELPYTLGDNPAVSSGAPISVSWIAQKRTILDLDFFERFRPERRNKRALQLSKDARKSMYVPNLLRNLIMFQTLVSALQRIDIGICCQLLPSKSSISHE